MRMIKTLNNNRMQIVSGLIGVVAVLAIIGVGGGNISTEQKTTTNHGTSTAFVMEVFDKIDANFWKDISERELTNYFAQGIGKLTNESKPSVTTRQELEQVVSKAMANASESNKQQLPAELADLVLRSLPPEGRSRLYTKEKKQQLQNQVKNVDPDTNLYDVLGTSQQASQAEIESAYENRRQQLQAQTDATTTQKELAAVDYAREVLADKQNRQQYDESKAEPTVFAERMSDDVVHLAIHRYNQRTPEEFARTVREVSMEPKPSSLILDLRSNVGGAIGVLPYLLGPFIGPDRAAYRFFQQGDRETYRTKTGWIDALVPYKKVVVLVNDKTQSTGELMASVLKKYNVGTVVGTTTRGWGTVERVMSLDNQYQPSKEHAVFLVHHLTVRSDGKPIQDRGVVPEVDITQDGWQQELRNYIPHEPLIEATQTVWNSPPPGTEI